MFFLFVFSEFRGLIQKIGVCTSGFYDRTCFVLPQTNTFRRFLVIHIINCILYNITSLSLDDVICFRISYIFILIIYPFIFSRIKSIDLLKLSKIAFLTLNFINFQINTFAVYSAKFQKLKVFNFLGFKIS